MTGKRMDQINRRTRIVQAIEAGVPYRKIAEQEGVTREWVNEVALSRGIRIQGIPGSGIPGRSGWEAAERSDEPLPLNAH
jgi:hypothetical protein